MSCGTFITARPGEEEQFHFAEENPIPASMFEGQRYFGPSNRFINDGLGVPIEKMEGIDRAFGRFLKGLQDSSFVHRNTALLGAPPFGMETRVARSSYARCSTLSPDTLRQSIRLNFARFAQEVADMLKKESTAASSTVNRPLTGAALLVDVDVSHSHDLNDADFLTPITRFLLDGYGEGCAGVANKTLLGFGKSVLNRADLLWDSTRADSEGFNPEHVGVHGVDAGDEIYYSTLDPRDLAERARHYAVDCMPGLMTRLPRAVQSPILERLKKTDAARKTIAPVPAGFPT